MVSLEAPPGLAHVLRLWESETLDKPESRLWLDLIGENHDAWHETNAHLADTAKAGDDEALVKLVRRDPRYLGTELVQARILDARLTLANARNQGIVWMEKIDTEAQQARLDTEARATAFLRALGRAIAHVGRGSKTLEYVPSEVVGFYESQVQALRRLWTEADVELDGETKKLRSLSLANRKRLGDEVLDELVRTFRASPSGVRALVTSARGGVVSAALVATDTEFKQITARRIKQIIKKHSR